ncbi:MAG: glycogen/starch/alpha-glucan phosphorylase, partial [Planctomycetales bacterium]|nr:glycogen/starch/alpha-glucan phosphorylase [Planctomycetales bacterium]
MVKTPETNVRVRDDISIEAPEPLGNAILHHLHFSLAKDRYSATLHDYYLALVLAVRERLIGRWLKTQQRYYNENSKRVYYLSLEFLTGRTLANALTNLGLLEDCRSSLVDLGLDLDMLIAAESEAGLGNGGLGRLAACLMDSMATLGIPGYGYGIRYEFGIFQQQIVNGAQVEAPDNWLRFGNPWEIRRPEDLYGVRFGGTVRRLQDPAGREHHEWCGGEEVLAMAYDTPVPGYLNNTVNTLRLWAAEPSRGFNFQHFNQGDYLAAVEDTSRSKSISRVLYPNDNFFCGKELRLKQEYFFVSASLQDIIRRHRKAHDSFDDFPNYVAIQLNDTHPALAIPELMRVLVDLEHVEWEHAWELTVATFGYTNHTLLPEALEEWPVSLLGRVLPRHLEIIYEINHRFLQNVKRQHPGDFERVRRMSIVSENDEKRIRMSHLAVVGSHAVNGVSKLHSDLLKTRLFRDFHDSLPGRLCSTTNGITPRRWLYIANPDLSQLITRQIGNGWIRDLSQLDKLNEIAEDSEFGHAWQQAKKNNKQRLAGLVSQELDLELDVDSLFDCQIKRIHEYKRQLLNVLHVIALYNRIRAGDTTDAVPRTVIFAGKAAPGYALAKSIVQLVHAVAEVINHDPRVHDFLKVVFLSNYGVSLAEKIIPACDLSEQISTAGTEASGTGNMKAMLNGALTIGTWDGANIEMREAVGDENIFMFGPTAEQVAEEAAANDPWTVYEQNEELQSVIDMVRGGFFTAGDPHVFAPLVDSL